MILLSDHQETRELWDREKLDTGLLKCPDNVWDSRGLLAEEDHRVFARLGEGENTQKERIWSTLYFSFSFLSFSELCLHSRRKASDNSPEGRKRNKRPEKCNQDPVVKMLIHHQTHLYYSTCRSSHNIYSIQMGLLKHCSTKGSLE